jgi:hypothetical protein
MFTAGFGSFDLYLQLEEIAIALRLPTEAPSAASITASTRG